MRPDPIHRVLQVAYACGPGRGSEPGAGWHRAVEAARSFEVWVICEGGEFAEPIQRYVETHGPIPGLRFSFVFKRGYERLLERLPGLYYFVYQAWQRRALRVARRLHAEVKFDLVHQVNISSFRVPGFLWKLGVPLVWGPVGGAQDYPWRFLGEAGLPGAVAEALRSVANGLQLRFSPRVRAAARRAAIVLASSSTNQRRLARALGISPKVLCDVGIEEIAARGELPSPLTPLPKGEGSFEAALTPLPKGEGSPEEPKTIKILWCGEFSPRKALSLMVKALARLPGNVAYELRVIGDGKLRNRWQRLARRTGVAKHMQMLGWLPRTETLVQYSWADVFVFTSLRDTTGTVILEAMAAGLPVICLDHQGAHDFVTEACGIKIPLTTPQQIADALRDAVATLARDADLRRRLSAGAVERVRQYLWSRNGEQLTEVYRQVLGAAAVDR